MVSQQISGVQRTLTLEQFWAWLQNHTNCILQVGSMDAAIHDHEDHHWILRHEPETGLIAQMLRGKSLIGELVINTAETAFVQVQTGERDDEWYFDLCNDQGQAVFYFVLAHDYDEPEQKPVQDWN